MSMMSSSRLERIVWVCADVLMDAERRIEAHIADRVPLEETADASVTRFVWLKQFEARRQIPPTPTGYWTASITSGGSMFRKVCRPHRITWLRRQGERYFADGAPGAPRQPPPRDSRGLRHRVGRCSSPTWWWRLTTGSSAERIAKPPGPAKRSSGTRRPRSARRSGHSPIADLGTGVIGARDTGPLGIDAAANWVGFAAAGRRIAVRGRCANM